MHTLTVKSLRKAFAGKSALNDLSFSMGADVSRLGVLGNNGAGKSTFLKILVGLIDADSGSIEVLQPGLEPFNAVTSQLGTFVSEHSDLLPNVTGKRFFKLYRALCEDCRIGYSEPLEVELAESLGLNPFLNKLCKEMSKGNQRKVELVATLSAQTPLFIADEITDGLDPSSRIVLANIIRQYPSHRQFIISSHDVDFLSLVAQQVITIDHGQVTGIYLNHGDDSDTFYKALIDAMQIRPQEMN